MLRHFPITQSLAGYGRSELGHDVGAGLIVGIVTIPQAVAYAFLAGLPPEAGLYGCVLPVFLYALLGSSRELAVGPVAIAALMVAATLSEHAHGDADAYVAIAGVLCLEVGAFLWLLRIFQMGGMVNLLSHPVLSGFVNGAAIMIIVSQLSPFAGLPELAVANTFAQALAIAERVEDVNPTTLALGVGALLLLWGVRRLPSATLARVGPFLVVVASAALVTLLDLDVRAAVATVGAIPAGLPDLVLPRFDAGLWLALVPSSALIALVVYIESFSLATTLAARHGRRVDEDQELIALGAANLGAAITGAYPVAGSFSRSGVNFSAGARTQISSLVAMGVVIATLLWLTPAFARLPQTALAAIIIAAVADLIDLKPLREYWSFYPSDTITHLVTLAGVVAFGVDVGLLLGVLVAIAFFVRTSSRPHIAIVGRIGDSAVFRNVERHRTETLPHVAAVRVDENLYFANAHEVEKRLIEIATGGGGQARETRIEHLLLVCSSVNSIDTSGLAMLMRVNDDLDRLGIRFHLSDVKGPVMDRLKTTRFPLALTGSIFFSTDLAMRDLEERET